MRRSALFCFEEPAKNLHFNCDERDRTRNRRNDRLPVILHPSGEPRGCKHTLSLSSACQYEILYFWIVAEETVARDDKRVHNGGGFNDSSKFNRIVEGREDSMIFDDFR